MTTSVQLIKTPLSMNEVALEHEKGTVKEN